MLSSWIIFWTSLMSVPKTIGTWSRCARVACKMHDTHARGSRCFLMLEKQWDFFFVRGKHIHTSLLSARTLNFWWEQSFFCLFCELLYCWLSDIDPSVAVIHCSLLGDQGPTSGKSQMCGGSWRCGQLWLEWWCGTTLPQFWSLDKLSHMCHNNQSCHSYPKTIGWQLLCNRSFTADFKSMWNSKIKFEPKDPRSKWHNIFTCAISTMCLSRAQFFPSVIKA